MNTPPDAAQSLIHGAVATAELSRRRLAMRAAIVEHDVLRLIRGEPLPRVSSLPPARPVRPSGRVLLVEDDADFGDSIGVALAAAGFEVARARGVVDAAEALAEEGFASVVVDFDLGEGYGSEVIEHARAANPAVRVVLMSGVVPSLLPDIAARSGVVDVLSKPFPPEDLLIALGPAPAAREGAH